jgi:hypothetical protein
MPSLARDSKRLIKKAIAPARPLSLWAESQLRRLNESDRPSPPHPLSFGDIGKIREATLGYVASMKVWRNGHFVGYRYSESATEPILYAVCAALLLKHLYNDKTNVAPELELILGSQSEDGLFRDPVIACRQAEIEDWWGWRHLTLHALMTLALYGIPARKELRWLDRFADTNVFCEYLRSRDWGAGAGFTSNELQNLGVMLQYARDYQNSRHAASLLEILYETLERQQDALTGLYGDAFDTPHQLSSGVQSGYHFWLVLLYDKPRLRHPEAIIDSALKTQNPLGGFGVRWNSSACEDIDSIDPLIRLSRMTDYRASDIKAALWKSLPAILHNLNADGGWVFRRHESLVFHPQMAHGDNESNVFYSWFRTLGLAYCLIGLQEQCPESLRYDWNLVSRAPGHQFL